MEEALNNAKILIVDAQEADVDILERFLEKQGYSNVRATTDSRQVVEIFEEGEPDLILLDLMMPHLSGVDLMEKLKDLKSSGGYIPIIVLSSGITQDAKQQAVEFGANDFLDQPFDHMETGLRIRNLLYARYMYQLLHQRNQIWEAQLREKTQELEKTNKVLIIAKNKAEESDRLKTALIRDISQEIRTPLNGILGFSDLLIDPAIDSGEKQQFIALIQDSSNKLLNTIEDYLSIALIVSGNMDIRYSRVDLNALLEEICSLFKEKADIKDLEININPSQSAESFMETDLELLKRILFHLLDNAIKFTRRGTITMGYERKPDLVEFFVKDTGIGIDETSEGQLFDIFTPDGHFGNRSRERHGIGLSLVKGLLNFLGGDIRFESVKGEGSVFYFHLPASKNKNI